MGAMDGMKSGSRGSVSSGGVSSGFEWFDSHPQPAPPTVVGTSASTSPLPPLETNYSHLRQGYVSAEM